MNPKEAQLGFTKGEEGSSTSDANQISRVSSSNSTSCSRWKDPRIVRVSRAFGGKDRHSKVFTVRGLRDRRVRLSVPTAIQLYDLQDRLGFDQPSKVVDWLLNAAKHGIDELPPLQMTDAMVASLCSASASAIHEFDKQGLRLSNSMNWEGSLHDDQHVRPNGNIWMLNAALRDAKLKEDDNNPNLEHDVKNQFQPDDTRQDTRQGFSHQFPNFNNSNSSHNYNPFLRWDPSGLSLCQSGNNHSYHSQHDLPGFNLVHFQSTQPYLPNSHRDQDFVQKHMLSSNSSSSSQIPFFTSLNKQPMNSTSQLSRPFPFSASAQLLPFRSNNANEEDQD